MRKFLGKLGGGNSRATPPRRHAIIAVFSYDLPRARELSNTNYHRCHSWHLDGGEDL